MPIIGIDISGPQNVKICRKFEVEIFFKSKAPLPRVGRETKKEKKSNMASIKKT